MDPDQDHMHPGDGHAESPEDYAYPSFSFEPASVIQDLANQEHPFVRELGGLHPHFLSEANDLSASSASMDPFGFVAAGQFDPMPAHGWVLDGHWDEAAGLDADQVEGPIEAPISIHSDGSSGDGSGTDEESGTSRDGEGEPEEEAGGAGDHDEDQVDDEEDQAGESESYDGDEDFNGDEHEEAAPVPMPKTMPLLMDATYGILERHLLKNKPTVTHPGRGSSSALNASNFRRDNLESVHVSGSSMPMPEPFSLEEIAQRRRRLQQLLREDLAADMREYNALYEDHPELRVIAESIGADARSRLPREARAGSGPRATRSLSGTNVGHTVSPAAARRGRKGKAPASRDARHQYNNPDEGRERRKTKGGVKAPHPDDEDMDPDEVDELEDDIYYERTQQSSIQTTTAPVRDSHHTRRSSHGGPSGSTGPSRPHCGASESSHQLTRNKDTQGIAPAATHALSPAAHPLLRVSPIARHAPAQSPSMFRSTLDLPPRPTPLPPNLRPFPSATVISWIEADEEIPLSPPKPKRRSTSTAPIPTQGSSSTAPTHKRKRPPSDSDTTISTDDEQRPGETESQANFRRTHTRTKQSKTSSGSRARSADHLGKKPRPNLPRDVTYRWAEWLYGNMDMPYPYDEDVVEMLMSWFGVTEVTEQGVTARKRQQLHDWIVNARRRLIQETPKLSGNWKAIRYPIGYLNWKRKKDRKGSDSADDTDMKKRKGKERER